MRVLLVGKGPPERGGIPTFLVTLQRGLVARGDVAELLNLSRTDATRQGGAASLSNLRRTLADTVAVWRAAGSADVVHVHTAG
ncbi:MAG TPA: hypothetical protein VGA69_01420, partial [Nitriliruptorales bacterium]